MRKHVEVEAFNGARELGDPPPLRKRVRYAPDTPLPAYRYVPGSGLPHPVNDPRGSLYSDVKPPPLESWTPHLWPVLTPWLHGVDLFNHWYFWEAHEAWEGLWQVVDKTQAPALFVQSLIQVGAAILKVHLGSLEGAQGLWKGADLRLTAVAAQHAEMMGLRPARVHKELRSFFKPLGRGALPVMGKDVPLLLLDV
jgi:hypothetical protein